MKKRYQQNVSKVARLTGYSRKQIRSFYKGNPSALARTAKSKSPTRSISAFRYQQNIRHLVDDLHFPREVAKAHYITHRSTTKERMISAIVEPNDSYLNPETRTRLSMQQVHNYGTLIKHGKNAGKFRLYFDVLRERPVSASENKKIRKDIRSLRMTKDMLTVPFNKYKKFHKYFTPAEIKKIKSRKKKQPTFAELKRAMRRCKMTHDEYDEYKEIFGHSA